MGIAPERRRRFVRAFERLMAAHILAWPVAIVWMVACIPVAIHLLVGAMDGFGGDEQAFGQYVAWKLLWPGGVGFVLAHGTAMPWAFGQDDARGKRVFWRGIGGMAAAGVITAAGTWLWLWLR